MKLLSIFLFFCLSGYESASAGSGLNLGLGYPYVSAKHDFSEKSALEARYVATGEKPGDENIVSTFSAVEPAGNSLPQRLEGGFIRGYQKYISPLRLRRGTCNFSPTCSAYARQAVARYGFLTGTMMATDRILRCHPDGEHGIDLPEWHYIYSPGGWEPRGEGEGKCRSPFLAGTLSVIPGLGKLYAGKTDDAIVSFCFVSLLGYLSYESLSKKAYVSGVVWTWLFGSFYAGNIYGSVDAARRFNLKYACRF